MELKIKNSLKQQQGIVLIVALIFLVSLTAIVSALMLNTTSDIKMSGASGEKLVAIQESVSAIDETIADQITGAGVNIFTAKTFPVVIESVTSVEVTDITITNDNDNTVIADCPEHQRLASSNTLIKCNVLTITVNNNYGRSDTSNINVNSGVAQQLIDVK